ncbi:ATP-binding protein [Sphingomonas oryzagri]
MIHDLRNLFGIVASARNCLGDLPQDSRARNLLEAIEQAAMRGNALTTGLLGARDGATGNLDVRRRLETLEPMLRAVTGRTVDLRLDLADDRSLLRAQADEFDAVLVELVVNACKALRTRGRIIVRARRRGSMVRIMVADNGRGMTPSVARQAERGATSHSGANGTGLGRIHRFVDGAHGSLRIRGRSGRGTVVSLALPVQPPRLVEITGFNPQQERFDAIRPRVAA